MADNELILTAIHEASHAFCARELGLGRIVQFVTCRDGGAMAYFEKRHRPRGLVDLSTPTLANKEICVQLAGPMGEAIYQYGADRVDVFADWGAEGSDWIGARHYADILAAVTGKTAEMVLVEAAQFVRDMLDESWPIVQAIADALLQTDSLSGCEVDLLCVEPLLRTSNAPGTPTVD